MLIVTRPCVWRRRSDGDGGRRRLVTISKRAWRMRSSGVLNVAMNDYAFFPNINSDDCGRAARVADEVGGFAPIRSPDQAVARANDTTAILPPENG